MSLPHGRSALGFQQSVLACEAAHDAGIYPGDKKIRYVSKMDTHPPGRDEPMPIYRVMDEDGSIRPDAEAPDVDRDTCLRMYSTMMRLQTMDSIFFDAQRQGRISFYMTNWGEEGTHIGTAMALRDDDEVFAQYREAGVLMWRGFSLQNFADQVRRYRGATFHPLARRSDTAPRRTLVTFAFHARHIVLRLQCFSNRDDLGKGRQMPVHYGSAKLHFQTISSPLATQIPQAAGAAYACKLEGKGRVAMCYFGDGAASEGDFHAGA
jgi:2-oxoisovalerate dehydrogenase E1 component alpha subunit